MSSEMTVEEALLKADQFGQRDADVPSVSRTLAYEVRRLRMLLEIAEGTVAIVEGWRQGTALVVRQLEEKLKKMPPSPWPGCGYCMERGTPVKGGEICPECGDRSPYL